MKRGAVFLAFVAVLITGRAHALTVQEVVGPKTGVKAWLVEEHSVPVIALRLAFQGGGEQDPVEKQGLASLTADALTQGAGSYDANAFQKELVDRSISLDFAAGRDAINGGLKCLREDKEKAFFLLREALTEPRFDREALERLEAQHRAAIRQLFADPSWQARYAFVSHAFKGHPYSQRLLGTLETLASITRDDVRIFAAQHMAKDTLTVAVAGDITPKELASALDTIFKDLPAHARLRPIEDIDVKEMPSPLLIAREGAQTEILFGMQGLKRADPDYYAAEIANYILGGGGFSSRLMQALRDEQGLTYGVATSLAPSQHAALIVGRLAVNNASAGEAFNALGVTIRRFYEDGPTQAEMQAAKDYLTGSMPLALTSTDKIADLLVAMQREDLGRDYLDRYNSLIQKVSLSDVQRIIKRFFNPAAINYVMVGDPEGVSVAQTQDVARP
ncbi:MAG: pitrilysin family protein [Alphaproteobacteria bacterium]|nr:pitrilysin family protein [Alphaproteobacteria bacterium]